jgi:chromosome segregation ATPase
MAGEISLDEKIDKPRPEGEPTLLGDLEEKIDGLLAKYQEMKKQRDELAISLHSERDKVVRLEKRLELLSQDRENVKSRIDQLLYRLKGIEG